MWSRSTWVVAPCIDCEFPEDTTSSSMPHTHYSSFASELCGVLLQARHECDLLVRWTVNQWCGYLTSNSNVTTMCFFSHCVCANICCAHKFMNDALPYRYIVTEHSINHGCWKLTVRFTDWTICYVNSLHSLGITERLWISSPLPHPTLHCQSSAAV